MRGGRGLGRGERGGGGRGAGIEPGPRGDRPVIPSDVRKEEGDTGTQQPEAAAAERGGGENIRGGGMGRGGGRGGRGGRGGPNFYANNAQGPRPVRTLQGANFVLNVIAIAIPCPIAN